MFSCSYYDEKPWFSPFFASLTTRSIFFLLINNIVSNQVNELKKELKELKEKK